MFNYFDYPVFWVSKSQPALVAYHYRRLISVNDLKLPIKQNKCECKVCQFIRRYKEIVDTLPNSEDKIFLMNHLDNFINLEEELGMLQEYVKDLEGKKNE